MGSFKERVERHDREIAAIRKLMVTGMKMIAKGEQEHVVFRRGLRELRVLHRDTGRELKAFIRSLRVGANGHSKRRVDLQ
jgi:hypothetical protein